MSMCKGIVLLICVVVSGAMTSPLRADEPRLVQTTVENFCVSCHGGESPDAKLNLASFVTQPVEAHPEVWEKVVRRLRGRQMPPTDQERPSEQIYVGAVAQLETVLDR